MINDREINTGNRLYKHSKETVLEKIGSFHYRPQ